MGAGFPVSVWEIHGKQMAACGEVIHSAAMPGRHGFGGTHHSVGTVQGSEEPDYGSCADSPGAGGQGRLQCD